MVEQPVFVASEGLHRLVARCAPLWGGEAEVVRTYWNSPQRTAATERTWVIHQMYKEYWDGVVPPLAAIQRMVPQVERGVTRAKLAELTKVLYEEVEHYALFADIFDLIKDAGELTPDPETIKRLGAWKENDTLMNTRVRHRQENAAIGMRACRFTEGGYCAMYSEGMKLRGRSALDDAIAHACTRIYEEEFDHMLLGILGIDDAAMSEADWKLLADMCVEQFQCRIHMRNAQFGYPVPAARIAELIAGKGEPMAFDYARAERLRGAH